ncbi:hypothetical protein GCWU000341_01013 [Oribacterium sp. oral taxon 078 str. F0262]|nr:hypothetical protein GCWU000341_01013 [Oribacterium sp. oral taxon 078 str. F0262]
MFFRYGGLPSARHPPLRKYRFFAGRAKPAANERFTCIRPPLLLLRRSDAGRSRSDCRGQRRISDLEKPDR